MISSLKSNTILLAKRIWRKIRRMRAYILSMINPIDGVVATAETVHGWITGTPAKELALASFNLAGDPTIVEIGVFMGRSTVLLASPRRLRGSGTVHSVDPFDCSGDSYSAPYYVNELKSTGLSSLEIAFRENISEMKLEQWVQVHKGTSREIASTWTLSIDLLLLDGDHSPKGAREAYDLWVPFLKKGGTIVLQNTADRIYGDEHNGNRRLAVEQVIAPYYSNIHLADYMTFAIKET